MPLQTLLQFRPTLGCSLLGFLFAVLTGCAVDPGSSIQRPVPDAVRRQLQKQTKPADRVGVMTKRDPEGSAVLGYHLVARSRTDVELPLVKTPSEGHAAVAVRINNAKPFPMILDTGAQTSMIEADRAVASRVTILDLASRRPRITGVLGQEDALLAQIESLSAEGFSVHGALALVRLQQSHLTLMGVPYRRWEANLLGMDVIRRTRFVTIDFKRRNVGLSFVRSFVTPTASDATSVPFVMTGGLPYIPVRLRSGSSFLALVDTGFNGTLRISSALAKKLGGKAVQLLAHQQLAMGLGGAGQYDQGATFYGLELGDCLVDELDGSVTKELAFPAIAGTELFRHFVMTFDFERQLLWLVPHERLTTAPAR